MLGKQIYLIPGRGEKLDDTLGRILKMLGYNYEGMALTLDVEHLWFSEQLELVRSDLTLQFWDAGSVLIGRSYGAYLLLHTLADMPPFPGRVLLFSPVLGAASSKDHHYGSIPPRAEKLFKLAKSNTFPAPAYMEIHTGAEDHDCSPLLAENFKSGVKNTTLVMVEGAGHNLSENYLRDILIQFFKRSCEVGRR
ncbi:MAG: hypothetical protein NT178_10860 [Proteobacteria bacterium]|nr:hypothetical protein [Pseudomonadota bacterium]